jgi:integrase
VKPVVKELERTPDGIKYRIRIQGVLSNGERVRERYTRIFATRDHALLFGRMRAEALLKKEAEPNKRETMPTLAEHWVDFQKIYFENARRGKIKPSTREAYKSHWTNHIGPKLGALRLNAIDEKTIDSFAAGLLTDADGDERSAKTRNNILGSLKTIFACAKKWHKVDIPAIPNFTVEPPAIEFWSFEDFDRLAVAANDLRPIHRAVLALGARQGLRCGEMLALRREDVDFTNGVIRVSGAQWKEHLGTTKSHKVRYLPLAAVTAAALRELPEHGPFWLTTKRKKRATWSAVRIVVEQIEARAGFRSKTTTKGGQIHKLRHTFASHLVMRGVPLRVVQLLLGHSTIAMTERYAHLQPSSLVGAMQALGPTETSGQLPAIENQSAKSA